jgi:hypothetical protein
MASLARRDAGGQTVAVNLSLLVDGRQVHDKSTTSPFVAWLERSFLGAAPAGRSKQ